MSDILKQIEDLQAQLRSINRDFHPEDYERINSELSELLYSFKEVSEDGDLVISNQSYSPESLTGIITEEVTYASLTSKIANNELRLGQFYHLTDYQTKHIIPGTNPEEYHTASAEPLICWALSTNKLNYQVYSSLYPNDYIEYDVNDDSIPSLSSYYCFASTYAITGSELIAYPLSSNLYVGQTFDSFTEAALGIPSISSLITSVSSFNQYIYKISSSEFLPNPGHSTQIGNLVMILSSGTGSITANFNRYAIDLTDRFFYAFGNYSSITAVETTIISFQDSILSLSSTLSGTYAIDEVYGPITGSLAFNIGTTAFDNNVAVNNGDLTISFSTSMGTNPRTGFISKRTDEYNNEAPYDIRGVRFKRNDTKYPTFVAASNCYGNIIGSSTNGLNDIVFKGTNCYNNTFGYNCYSMTFESDCSYNIFGNGCYNNVFGTNCYNNAFGSGFGNNTIGDHFRSNVFGENCFSNTFGNSCHNNIIFDNFQQNTASINFYNNYIQNDCKFNTFGAIFCRNIIRNECQTMIVGSSCHSNIIGNSCVGINIGTVSYANTFGTGVRGINLSGKSAKYNNFPDYLNTSLSTCTIASVTNHLTGSYTCNLYSRQDGTYCLTYISTTGGLEIISLTS